jgi:hypothetical protein
MGPPPRILPSELVATTSFFGGRSGKMNREKGRNGGLGGGANQSGLRLPAGVPLSLPLPSPDLRRSVTRGAGETQDRPLFRPAVSGEEIAALEALARDELAKGVTVRTSPERS